MSSLVLSRALTATDDGMHTWTVVATQNGQSASLVLMVTITPAAVVMPVFSGWNTNVMLPDNSAAGTVVSSGTLMMSDGSAFTGTIVATDENNNPAPITFMP